MKRRIRIEDSVPAEQSNQTPAERAFSVIGKNMDKLDAWEKEFVGSVNRQMQKKRITAEYLSDRQKAVLYRILGRIENPPAPPPAYNVPNLVNIFAHAAERLRYPKVTFRIEDGKLLRFQRAGERSKYPGCLQVTDARPFGENVWYGRVVNGVFNPSPKCDADTLRFVMDFNADPAAFAAQYGHNSGHCCFCNKELTDARSVSVGYGPVCAGHYGLPWG